MEKKKYIAPQLELIELDNDVSLALESSPPEGPNEGSLYTPEYLKSDPFQIHRG
jgi:hypothetical protein